MRRTPLLSLVSMLLVMSLVLGCATTPTAEDDTDSSATEDSASDSSASEGDASEGGASDSESAEEDRRGGTLRYGANAFVETLDPHVDYGKSSSYTQGNLYDTLLDYSPEGELIGALAESWDIPDQRTYVFHLREDVVFHDGTSFNADDVLATFDRIADPDTGAAGSFAIDMIEEIEAEDDYTVRIVLKEPNATFLHVLAASYMFIVSAEDIEQGFDFAQKANGTGAFKLASWEPGVRYEFERNPDYWEAGLPYLDKVIITPYADIESGMSALRAGTIDFMEFAPVTQWDMLESEGLQVFPNFGAWMYVRLGVTEPPLDDRRVRQALNYIVDREEINQLAWAGQGKLVTGALQPPGSPYRSEDLQGYYTKDRDRARELLREAGYDSPADVPALELAVWESPLHGETAQVVQQQLRDFGLEVGWRTVDAPTLLNHRAEGGYQLMQDGDPLPVPDPDFLRLWFHSEHGTRYATGAGFSNAEIDELLERGAASVSAEERAEIYREAEELLLEEAPWIFLVWRPQADAASPEVRGFTPLPGALMFLSGRLLHRVWLDD